MKSTGLGVLLLGLSLCLPSVGRAVDHVPGPLNVEVTVGESETEVYLLIDELLFRHWFQMEPTEIPDLDPESVGDWGEFGQRIVTWLEREAPLQVDGVQVIPVIDDLEWQEGFDLNDFLNYVGVTLKYPTKSLPQELEFLWSRYDTEDGFPLESVYMILTGADDFQILRFREDDPFQFWSPPEARPVIDPESVPPGLTPPLILNLGWLLVILSLARLGLGTFDSWGARVPWLVLLLVGFVAPLDVSVSHPLKPAIQLPKADDSVALFETLHRNIYRAFDYEDEGQIYDILARSVNEEILPDLYDDVHESLMMKIEEQAISKVETVRNIESRVDLPENPDQPAYDVFATWEVIGTVKHYGHGHWRKNVSRARYTVEWIEDLGWRIAHCELIDQRRIDDGQESVK